MRTKTTRERRANASMKLSRRTSARSKRQNLAEPRRAAVCVALENETSFFVSDVSETPTHRIAFRSVATASDDADDGARWYKYRRASRSSRVMVVATGASASASCLVFGGDGSRKTMVMNRLVRDALMTDADDDGGGEGRRSAVVEVRWNRFEFARERESV